MWGELFRRGTAAPARLSFHKAAIAGSVHATWRDTATGPDLKCTLRIVPEMSDFPNFRVSYNLAKSQVRLAGLETPVYRYSRFVGSTDPMCGGGPEIDVFGPPAHWNPRGDGGAALPLSGGGVHRYDRNWSGVTRSAGDCARSYLSSDPLHAAGQLQSVESPTPGPGVSRWAPARWGRTFPPGVEDIAAGGRRDSRALCRRIPSLSGEPRACANGGDRRRPRRGRTWSSRPAGGRSASTPACSRRIRRVIVSAPATSRSGGSTCGNRSTGSSRGLLELLAARAPRRPCPQPSRCPAGRRTTSF